MSVQPLPSFVEDVVNRLRKKNIATKSELGARDENAQRRKFVQSIPPHKYEEKAMDKVLISTELAFAFNVYTGEVDDQYNEKSKWRLTKDAITTALSVKALAHEIPNLKAKLLEIAGLTEWAEFDVLDRITKADWAIFRPHRVARTFTETVAMINSKEITGFENPIGYSVKVERDDFGRLVGDTPIFLMIQKFFSDMNYEEAQHLKKLRKEATSETWKDLCKSDLEALKNYDIVAMEEKKFNKEVLREVYSQGLVSDERPINYFIAYKFKIDRSTSMIEGADKLSTLTLDDMDKSLVLLKKSSALTEAFEKFQPGKPFARGDVHFNFFELDLQGPESVPGDDSTKRMLIAQKTQVVLPTIGISSVHKEDPENPSEYPTGYVEGFRQSVTELIRKKNDDLESIEMRFRASTKARPLTEEVEGLLVSEMKRRNYLMNQPEFLTKDILLRNQNLFKLIHEDEAIEYFAALEAGLEDAKDGEAINEDTKSGDMAEVDLSANADSAEVAEDEGSYVSQSVEVTELEL